MSLIDEMMEPCVILDRTSIPDGDGGFDSEWSEGAEIKVAIVNDSSIQARIAEADGFRNTYTLTTKRNVVLDYGTVIKCIADGKLYRVTADGSAKKSPKASNLNMAQVSAELLRSLPV